MRFFSSLCIAAMLCGGLPSGTAAAAVGEAPAVSETPAAAVESRADLERFSGLYQGVILYREGSAELEVTVELGLDAEGRLGGTIDMPPFDILYHPLSEVRVDGDGIYLAYRHFSEVRGPDALYEFEGRLSDDGGALVGEFLENRGRIPFRFERLGEPGTPRPELEPRPLLDLDTEGDGLRAAFNEHPDRVRLILLLSPT